MEESCPVLSSACRVCGYEEFRFAGLQWLPISTIQKMGGTPRFVDPEKPETAAVKLYICAQCGNSFIEI
ncbi:MAG: hypothetical protein ABI835_09970 [Chloroflexota bacterium]